MSTNTVLNDAGVASGAATGGSGPFPAGQPGPGNPYVMLRRGLHPATRLPLLSGSRTKATCGGCALRFERATTRGPRDKCAALPFRARGGADVPANLPACQAYTPPTPEALPAGSAMPDVAPVPVDARSAA